MHQYLIEPEILPPRRVILTDIARDEFEEGARPPRRRGPAGDDVRSAAARVPVNLFLDAPAQFSCEEISVNFRAWIATQMPAGP
jgi:hypothetical protein